MGGRFHASDAGIGGDRYRKYYANGHSNSEVGLARKSILGNRKYLAGATLSAVTILERSMDPEKTIAEIELLERMFAVPDNRPFSMADREAANRKHDSALATSPWFKLWQSYGLPR